MNSSTSSFNTAFLTIAIAAVLMLPAVFIVNTFTHKTEEAAGDIFGVQRIRSSVEALPLIATSPEPSAVFFGSSLTKDGFSPRIFDQQFASQTNTTLSTYNLGMGNTNPAYQRVLSRRVVEAFEQTEQQLEFVMIELTPFLMTQTRYDFRPFMTEQVMAIMMSPAEIIDTLWQNPEHFARLMSIRYLRNGVSAEAITGGIRFLLAENESRIPLVRKYGEGYKAILDQQKQLQTALDQLLKAERPYNKKLTIWSPESRGGLIDMSDLSPEAQALAVELADLMRHPTTLALDLKGRVNCCDILNLDFNEQYIQDYLATIENFKKISKRIVLVQMPVNHSVVKLSDQAMSRQHALIERIKQLSDTEVLDLSALDNINGEHFYDSTHLAMDSGKILFSKALAEAMVNKQTQQDGF